METSKKTQPVWRCTNGNITREEGGHIAHIATYDQESNRVSFADEELEKKFRLSVIAKLKKWGFEGVEIDSVESEVEDEDEPFEPDEEAVVEAIEEPKPKPARPKTLTVEQKKAVQRLRREQGFPSEVESPASPEPPFTDFGSKDPAFVEWLLRYHPEEFALKYRVIGEGSIQVKENVLDPKTQTIRKVVTTKEGVLSESKTHLTLKPVKFATNRRRR